MPGFELGVLDGGVTTDSGAGTPQGSPISPLMANIALHTLDVAWREQGPRLGVLIRYADDIAALCPTRERAIQARTLMVTVLAPLGLQLHPDKTSIVHLHHGVHGFDFLGFHHHKVEAWRWPGRYYLQRWPSARAMTAIRGKVRDATSVRHVGHSLTSVVTELNPVLRGWGGYFRRGNSAGSSPPWTAMSKNAWRSSTTPNADVRAEVGACATTAPGTSGSAYTASPGRSRRQGRMPDGERCR